LILQEVDASVLIMSSGNFTHTTIANFLQAHYERRHDKNPAYSYRAFARDLGVSRSQLSDILRGLSGASAKSIRLIAKGLELSDQEYEFCMALSQRQFARATARRSAAEQKIADLTFKSKTVKVEHDVFTAASDWLHFAILELSLLRDFSHSAEWIGAKLGCAQSEIKEATARLLRLGLAKIEGDRFQTSTVMAAGGEVPSAAIRKFHKQVLDKASEAIEQQSIDRRFLSSYFISLRQDQIPRATEKIKNFLDDFATEFDNTQEKDRLYALSLQFFDLLQPERTSPHA
jgi:uncharacterized protein (TIGR02147 family)